MNGGLLANASCNINGYPKSGGKDNIYTIQKANTPILSPPHDYINNHRRVKTFFDFITTPPRSTVSFWEGNCNQCRMV